MREKTRKLDNVQRSGEWHHHVGREAVKGSGGRQTARIRPPTEGTDATAQGQGRCAGHRHGRSLGRVNGARRKPRAPSPSAPRAILRGHRSKAFPETRTVRISTAKGEKRTSGRGEGEEAPVGVALGSTYSHTRKFSVLTVSRA